MRKLSPGRANANNRMPARPGTEPGAPTGISLLLCAKPGFGRRRRRPHPEHRPGPSRAKQAGPWQPAEALAAAGRAAEAPDLPDAGRQAGRSHSPAWHALASGGIPSSSHANRHSQEEGRPSCCCDRAPPSQPCSPRPGARHPPGLHSPHVSVGASGGGQGARIRLICAARLRARGEGQERRGALKGQEPSGTPGRCRDRHADFSSKPRKALAMLPPSSEEAHGTPPAQA